MFTNALTAVVAQQHIEDLRRDARTARRVRKATARPGRARKARNDRSWLTLQRWHVTTAH